MYNDELPPLENIARGLFAIARALDRLGTNDAATTMGAIEMLAQEIKLTREHGMTVLLDSDTQDLVASIADSIAARPPAP